MLEIFDLDIAYKDDKPVLKGLSLSVAKGEVFGILGMNGAGKTTLFNTTYGLISPIKGGVHLFGKPIHYTNIAFLETENYFYPYIKGLEYLNLVTKGAFNVALNKIFELPLNDLVDTYSTGMKKKLAFWAVFESEQELVILDEPFNGIDIESVECFYNLIREMRNQGKIIIIAAHVIETLTRVCDRIGYLNGGAIEKIYQKENYSCLQNYIQQLVEEKVKNVLLQDG